ncbi:hypothetical protein UO65_2026 [Actinokineospora spheciospongiae]|uniref:Uncharacterized protein n=1 Tax=Actinokineospora spheciospongiae TaxID=909613 RepID=W7J9I9_9PSEU|nr:hypothetical protein [Actinokineospora spheciospongiae]EWC62674.1 hypothetical protein UO65_2026 [Actinokineospora spheciospongiae]
MSVETWVEMTHTVPMRFEACALNDNATLHFGQSSEYVLTLGRDNLRQLVDLATLAIAELDSAVARGGTDDDPARASGAQRATLPG